MGSKYIGKGEVAIIVFDKKWKIKNEYKFPLLCNYITKPILFTYFLGNYIF